MIVYRLTKINHCNDLSGAGAEIAGGRWSNKGTGMLYTSESRALCTAEIAVHIPIGIVPNDYYLIIIEIPDSVSAKTLAIETLPDNWKRFPASKITQKIGEEFILNGSFLVLKVPSAVVQGDFNYLLNPNHKDFNKVKIVDKEKFNFDERLFK